MLSANLVIILMELNAQFVHLSAQRASVTESVRAASLVILSQTQQLKDNVLPANHPASHAQVLLPTVLHALLAIPRRTGYAKIMSMLGSASPLGPLT